jgi:hypothetical protein
MKNYLFLICLIFFSCQEEITLDLPQAVDKLVVEGAIEPGFPPYVILTKNQGYFDRISDNPLLDIIVNDADSVKVWYYNANGEKEIRILEQLPGLDSLAIYTVNDYDFLNQNPVPYEFSKSERTYYLEIHWNNQIITAETTIPQPTPLDCLWVEQSETADKDFKCDIRAVYSDDANIQNNILIRSKRIEHWKREDTISGEIKNENDPQLLLIDAGPDVLLNGESFETYFPRPNNYGESGFPSGSYNTDHYKTFNNNGTEDTVFLPHDIVLIKFCQIDEPSLKFWRVVVRQFATNGNPFAEPINLVSNINGGLGAFTGYGSVYYKVPIIKDTTILEEYLPGIIDIF